MKIKCSFSINDKDWYKWAGELKKEKGIERTPNFHSAI